MAIVSTELEVQDITTLPKRTASGIDPDTDFVLGVEENGVAYKADIEDLGQSIVQGAKSNLLGRNQTVASAFSMLREETNEKIKESYGAPLVANQASDMKDKTRVYVYTGTGETGYQSNRWYYWNGVAWTMGGQYYSGVLATDTTLSLSGYPADSKAVGDALDEVNTELSSITDDVEQLQEDSSGYTASTSIAPEYSPSGIYAVGDYCMHNGMLYRCTTAISTAEAWNANHWTADSVKNIADGLKSDVSDLKDDFDEALSPSVAGLHNLCTGIQKGKYWVAWNQGDTVTLTDNASYMAATVPLGSATHITLNRGWDSNSFCFYADADNKRIGLIRDYQISGVNYAYNVPSGAVYAYISQNVGDGAALAPYIDTDGVVVLEGSTSILGTATIAQYPYGGSAETNYYADVLRMASVSNKKLSEILPPLAPLPNAVIKSTQTIYGKANLSDFNDAPNNSLITVLIPASTVPADLPANYPVGHVIKGVGQLVTYISSDSNIKIQTYRNAVQGLTYTRQYTVGTGWQAWYMPNVKKRYTCLKNGTGDFNSLVTAINTICEEMDAELFVGPGTWDIISELGADYMNAVSSSSSTWGLVLKNRIHIICSANSLITAKYTGSNTNVKTYFSAFNAGEYGFTLENANIETDNVRYTIHDDRGGGGGEGYYNRYINCSMKHTNGMYTDCIGGGLGTNGLIEILNCYFEGDTNAVRLAYYHGNNYSGQTNAQCKLIVKGNYFAGLGTFGLTKYGDSTKVSTAYVSDNSIGSALFVNSGSYAPQDNMEMIEWNNVVRT